MSDKPDLESAFAVVANWFETFFEAIGPEVGKSFGKALRSFSDLATSSHKYWGEEWQQKVEELDIASDRLLMEFFLHYINAKGYRVGRESDGRIDIRPSEN
jgi:hypothetical protein